MKDIFYVRPGAIYLDLLEHRKEAADSMADLILTGEDGDELLKAATAYDTLDSAVKFIEASESAARDDAQK